MGTATGGEGRWLEIIAVRESTKAERTGGLIALIAILIAGAGRMHGWWRGVCAKAKPSVAQKPSSALTITGKGGAVHSKMLVGL
jgi:hypothetical protein